MRFTALKMLEVFLILIVYILLTIEANASSKVVDFIGCDWIVDQSYFGEDYKLDNLISMENSTPKAIQFVKQFMYPNFSDPVLTKKLEYSSGEFNVLPFILKK